MLGIPLLENKKVVWCVGFCFFVSRCQGFLVVGCWFESVLVSWFQSFKDPWMFSKVIGTISEIIFHVFVKRLISSQSFQDFIRRIAVLFGLPKLTKVMFL